jgi:hypothetical protein
MSAEHKAHLGAVLEHHASMGKHLAAMHDGGDGKDGKDGAEKVAKVTPIDAPKSDNAEITALKTEVADLTKNFKEFLEELGKSIPKKSDLAAGAVAKSAAGAVKSEGEKDSKEDPREVVTPGGNKVDLAKFGRDTLAKPLFVNPTIAR